LAALVYWCVCSACINTPSSYDLRQQCIESTSSCNLYLRVLEVKIEQKDPGTRKESFEKASYAVVISTDNCTNSF
jgi:hypothetical protein